MKNKILIISNSSESVYYKSVIKIINSDFDQDVYLLDYNSFPSKNTMSLFFNAKDGIIGSIPVTCFTTSGSKINTKILISEIQKVWPIRFGNVRVDKNLDDASKLFAEKQSYYSLNSLISIFDCEVINKPLIAKYVQDNKLYQLIIAEKNGLQIPNTLISSSFKDVKKFINDNGGSVLIKPIFSVPFFEETEKKIYGIYSNIITSKDISSDSVKICPSIYQEYINKKIELRISYAKGDILTCAIDSQSSQKTKIDWRNYDFKNVKHSKFNLPEKIKKLLRKCMGELDLEYGQIDMIITPEEKFVFLEINPSGQWQWIQKITGLKIDKSIAKMLVT